jgi:hypothetical protein
MSSNRNSITPRFTRTLPDIAEALGVTQFPTETGWYQITAGRVTQGGYVSVADGATANVAFHAPHEKQTLGVWIQTVGGTANGAYVAATPTLTGFQIVNGAGVRGYYWKAEGV